MPMKNKAKIIQRLLVLISILTVFSCKSIIEEDITGKQVSINSPTASSMLESYNQTFWWNPMDGITKYEVLLVTKSFTDIQKLIFDTLVTGTKFKYTLSPGEYEWRIRGVNGNYKSDYSGSKFTILVSDIKKQYVTLSSPVNTNSTNTNPLVLSWLSLYGADGYRIQIDKTNSFTTAMVVNTTTPGTSYTLASPQETTYYWRVKAFNSASDSSLWSSVNSFTYDITAPDKVVLTSPANNLTDANTKTGTLKWTDLGANTKYIVYIQYGAAAETQSSLVSINSYAYTAIDGQTVKWKVQAVDAAGNKGLMSDQWQFKIQ